MKKIKYIFLILLIGAIQSCDYLDLSPVDSYGISNYWSTKDQVERYVRVRLINHASLQEMWDQPTRLAP